MLISYDAWLYESLVTLAFDLDFKMHVVFECLEIDRLTIHSFIHINSL